MTNSRLPPVVYATFSGQINQDAVARIFHNFGGATQGGVTDVHFLFQSMGGLIGDGISLYNYFRTLPLNLHIYNTGTVSSIAVLAYLGAQNRYTSAHATFGIHKSKFPSMAASDTAEHGALARQLKMEDARTEAILKAHTQIPRSKWRAHARHDVFFDADEAVKFGLAQQVREFQIPPFNPVFNI